MESIQNTLSFEIIWQDPDMVELKIMAANDEFSGATEVYTIYDDIWNFSKSLDKFPKSIGDTVEFSAGKKDSYAYANMRFYCFTASGHTASRIELESNVATEFRPEEKNRIELELQFEAAALDSFVLQLRKIVNDRQGKAVLAGISPYTQNIA